MPSSFSKSNRTLAAVAAGAAVVTYAGNKVYKARTANKYDDGIDVNNQSVEIDPVEHIRRCTFYKDVDIYSYYKTIYPNIKTLGDVIPHGYTLSNNGPCVTNIDLSIKQNPLNWISYSQALEKIRYIGSHLWTNVKLIPNESKVAIISPNRAEYTFVEHACYMYGFIVVALYTSYDSATVLSLLDRTDTDVLVVDSIARIQPYKEKILQNTRIKQILIMDDEVTNTGNERIKTIPSILKTMQQADVRPLPKIDPDDTAAFILTSGTTGEPKLAMLSHTNILASMKGVTDRRQRANLLPHADHLHVSYLPLAHLYERLILILNFIHGSQVAYCPTPEKVFECYQLAKPTGASMVPRILNKAYDTIMTEVNKSKIKRFLISQALHNEKPSLYSRFIFRKIKNLFGGRLEVMVTGSAPITHEVLHFFRIALDIPIIEAYGQTESTGSATSTHGIDLACGMVGSPVAAVELKLIDVPGTNYRSDNNQGEVCIRGPVVFKGYYGDEKKTRETIDEGGWLHTGDVGEWTSTGTLRIIDRTKHIFKLNQGEYIAPERLEDVYLRSRWVNQIFVDGIPTESTVVAIVVPDEEYVRQNFKTTATSFEDICKDEKLNEIILNDLKRLAREYKFKYYETISNIHLHSELFSQENGLVTSTLKTRRTAVRQYFQDKIQSLYEGIEKLMKPITELQSKL
ncbi:unnamed protein product [Adineta steineri]|uniref:long-chain-fatty-acid--CoA ligase n=1 Tax=Adineta steineri TaxID=433720 RepID=A0A818VWH7_9BILA|nr:unnamed protein product [Adineta steineri]